MVKAIFFDIDGTLISFRTHRISPAVLDALSRLRQKGIKLFLATGRHASSIGAAQDDFPFDGCITLNGQYCFTQDTVLRKMVFSPAQTAQLADVLEQTGAPAVILEEKDGYMVNPDPRLDLFPNQLNIPLPPEIPASDVRGRELYQAVVFLSKEEEKAVGTPFQGLDAMRWHPDFADVISQGGGKDRGMDAILEHFKISLNDTMAFGDGENDLPMLRHAHIGVAMGNASDEVKSQADYVTDCVDEDGILSALIHFGILEP